MRYVGNRTMSAGGYINGSGVAPGDIDLDQNSLNNVGGITNSSQKITIGTPAASSHSMGANQVHVTVDEEHEGSAYFDGTTYFYGYASFRNNASFGANKWWDVGEPGILFYANKTLDQFILGLHSDVGNQILIAPYGYYLKDWGLPSQSPIAAVITSDEDPDTDATQISKWQWNRLALGGDGGGLGCVNQTISYSDFIDGGGLIGTLDLDEGIPDGAVVIQAILHTLTGFTGGANTAATVQIGDGTDVDRYNTATPSVYTTNASGCDLGVPSGTKWHDDAKTVTVTVTVDNDFSTIAAGECTVAIFYFTP